VRSLLLAAFAAAVLAACPPPENPMIDAGLGGGGGSTGGGGGGGSGMDGGAGGGGGGSACTPDWQCGPWQPQDGGVATRTCLDANVCGDPTGKPDQGPAALPALDQNYYRCNVQPVFDRGCAMLGCHGTDSTARAFRVYARGRLRNNQTVPQVSTCLNPGQPMNLQQEGTGTVMCLGWSRLTKEEWDKNFDGARAFALGLASTTDSELLTQPLEGTAFAHAGVKLYDDTNDTGYQTVRAWLGGATSGACDAGAN